MYSELLVGCLRVVRVHAGGARAVREIGFVIVFESFESRVLIVAPAIFPLSFASPATRANRISTRSMFRALSSAWVRVARTVAFCARAWRASDYLPFMVV